MRGCVLAKKPKGDSPFIKGIMRNFERQNRKSSAILERLAGQGRRRGPKGGVNPDRYKSPLTRRLEAAAGVTTPIPSLGARVGAQQPSRALEPFRREVSGALEQARKRNADKSLGVDERIAGNIAAARACARGLEALCEHHFKKGGKVDGLTGEDSHLFNSCVRDFHACHSAVRGMLGSYNRIGGSSEALRRQHEIALAAVRAEHREAMQTLKRYVPGEQIPKVG
jgi:hypothetical protein